MLCEFGGGSSLNQAAAQSTGEPDSLTIYIGTGISPECQRVRSITKINPYFFKHGIRIVLNQLQRFFVQYTGIGNLTTDISRGFNRYRRTPGCDSTRTPTGSSICWSTHACSHLFEITGLIPLIGYTKF